jgi:hypothetical protein
MRKTLFCFFSVFVYLVFIFCAFASSEEIDIKEFQGGVLLYEFSQFKEKDWPKEFIDKLLACSDCPGIDGYLPNFYTKSLVLKMDNKVYRLPKHLIQDLYNPHVGKKYYTDVLRVLKVNKRIIVNMSGGDGIAAYRAKFTINLENKTIRRELFQLPISEKAQIKEGKVEVETGK